MNPRILQLLVLPALLDAFIVDIQPLVYLRLCRMSYRGDNKSPLTEGDLHKFNLDETQMLAIAGSFAGAVPDRVFTNNPSLYSKRGWDLLEKHVEPVEIKMIDWQSLPVTLASREIINNGTNEASFDANLSKKVFNKLTTSWQDAGGWSVRAPVRYNVVINRSNGMYYKGSWNENIVKKWPMKLAPTSRATVRIQPGERREIALVAMRHEAVIDIDFEIEIDGELGCFYNKYSAFGSRYMAISMKDAMEQSNMEYKLLSTVTISVEFYTDPNIVTNNI